MVTDIHIAGELECWPSKDDMAALLSSAGLNVTVDRYSVRVNDCEHFVFQEYGGDLGNPTIDADAETLPKMLVDAGLVSNALAAADIRHRFEIYAGDEDGLVGYQHHKWPQLPGMNGPPYETNIVFCPHCDEHREEEEFAFLCIVPELGNINRYHCRVCGGVFVTLPPSFAFDADGKPVE